MNSKSNQSAQPQNKSLLIRVGILFVTVGIAAGTIVYSTSDWSAPARVKNLKNPIQPDDATIVAGRSIYRDRCANCHGERGDGRGEKAEQLSIAPSDFTDTHKMSASTDGELFWRISKGKRPMPAFKDKLSEQQRWELVDYIRTFSARLVDAPLNATPPAVPNETSLPKDK
jgi:mono/diheme cytochrome c family protein